MDPITFYNFYFRYKGNDTYSLNNINLKIAGNKFILLAGETASGKTTLIRCMNGLIPQFYPGYYKGYIEIAGKNTETTSIADLSTEVGIVFQDPENQLIAMNVEHEIAFGLENIGMSPEKIREKIQESARITEIEHLLDKAPFELSGGEQQRVAIASILVLEPKVLILDEPTAQLDPYMAKKIIYLLKEIQNEKSMTIIISEHRLDLVLPLVDEIILLKEGWVIEHDDREKVINGTNFHELGINKPVIYSIFDTLKNYGIYENNLPASIQEAITSLKIKKNQKA